MDILNQFDGKINGVLETFDRVIINGYIQQLHSFRLFLFYLIQQNVLLKDFDSFARQQTDILCRRTLQDHYRKAKPEYKKTGSYLPHDEMQTLLFLLQ